MSERFLYTTYIRTTAERLWDALRKPEFTRAYWRGIVQDSSWEKGAPWRMDFADGRIANTGSVVEIDPPRRLVLSWRAEFQAEMKAEGYSRCTFTLEPQDGGVVKLTVLHEIDCDGSKLIESVSGGWPSVLSSLKSLLETGKPLSEDVKTACAAQ